MLAVAPAGGSLHSLFKECPMICCELTLPVPEENLACDEALLDLCEESPGIEVMRFWESPRYFVALGYADRVETETNVAFCRLNGIPLLRRCTGGGTVLQGPGCLNYSLVLRQGDAGPLANISTTNQFILTRHQAALASLLQARVELRGHTDLAIGGLKFSGNAQRRKKHCLLFHGTFLLHLDLEFLGKILPMPSKQPDYRAHRTHADFLMNLKVPARLLKDALRNAWDATGHLEHIPYGQIERLTREKYTRDEWNLKF